MRLSKRKILSIKVLLHIVVLPLMLLVLLDGLVRSEVIQDQDVWARVMRKEAVDFRIKNVEMKVNAKEMLLTVAAPSARSGKEVRDFASAFTTRTIKASDGKVVLPLSTIPIYLEEPGTRTHLPDDAGVSPFGIQGPKEYTPNFTRLGVNWVRSSGNIRLSWGEVEPERGRYNFEHLRRIDKAISGFNSNNVNMMITVYVQNPWDQLGDREGKKFWKKWKRNPGKQEGRLRAKLPKNSAAFLDFIQFIVERYDGDGIDDAPGSPVVHYWQIVNEADLDWKDSKANFARLVKHTYKAVKKADPNAKVVLSGVGLPRGFPRFYVPMLEKLDRIKDRPGERYFDVFDFHWFVGGAGGYIVADNKHFMGGIKSFKSYLDMIRSTLNKYGYNDIPIWITEMCTHTGKPKAKNVKFPHQTEMQQASELVKRFVYPLSLGVDRIFWSRIVDTHNYKGKSNSFFNHVGLVYNPKNKGRSAKKLSFYTYKLLIEKLAGSDWGAIEKIDMGEGVFAYRFKKNTKSVYVMWLK